MTGLAESSSQRSRRDELLGLAATMFAERGLRATTVRDIADAAGILSGSLYHHFDSKEAIVDELLRDFLEDLFGRYREIATSDASPVDKLRGLFMVSFDEIENKHAQVAIYQSEAPRLLDQERFAYLAKLNVEQREMWIDVLREGIEQGYFRPDLDVTLVYRFIRDTMWVTVRWFRPGGSRTAQEVAEQYLSIVLGGITVENN